MSTNNTKKRRREHYFIALFYKAIVVGIVTFAMFHNIIQFNPAVVGMLISVVGFTFMSGQIVGSERVRYHADQRENWLLDKLLPEDESVELEAENGT